MMCVYSFLIYLCVCIVKKKGNIKDYTHYTHTHTRLYTHTHYTLALKGKPFLNSFFINKFWSEK